MSASSLTKSKKGFSAKRPAATAAAATPTSVGTVPAPSTTLQFAGRLQPSPALAVPFSASSSTIRKHYNQYVEREALHLQAFKAQSARQERYASWKAAQIEYFRAQPRHITYGPGYIGHGNGTTETRRPSIIFPARRPRSRPYVRDLRVPRHMAHAQADALESLVPLRLDIETDRYRLKDTFTWNLSEVNTPLEYFSEVTCHDYGLPPSPNLVSMIHRSLLDQLTDYYPHPPPITPPPTDDEGQPYTALRDDDMRILIKLDITVGQLNLIDNFEWDINSVHSQPEAFARVLVDDLALPSEFVTAIAHSIREQAQMYTRSLYLAGHPFDGRAIEDPDVRFAILPTMYSSIRIADGPILRCVEMNQVHESTIQDLERDHRRRRRIRRTTALNFSDITPTHRSAFSYSGIPGSGWGCGLPVIKEAPMLDDHQIQSRNSLVVRLKLPKNNLRLLVYLTSLGADRV